MQSTLERVVRCIEEVFANKGETAPPLSAETFFTPALGLDSLDYAEMIVRLEGEFGVDPFAAGTPGEIRTVADLAALYDGSHRAS